MNKKIGITAIILLIVYILISLYFLLTAVSLGLSNKLFCIPIDKVLHFLMFIPYPILFWMIIRYNSNNYRKKISTYLLIFLISAIIGAATEIMQSFNNIPRDGDIKDLVADSCGIAVTLLILWILEDKIDRLIKAIAGLFFRKKL